jgi:hypothetical protein
LDGSFAHKATGERIGGVGRCVENSGQRRVEDLQYEGELVFGSTAQLSHSTVGGEGGSSRREMYEGLTERREQWQERGDTPDSLCA